MITYQQKQDTPCKWARNVTKWRPQNQNEKKNGTAVRRAYTQVLVSVANSEFLLRNPSVFQIKQPWNQMTSCYDVVLWHCICIQNGSTMFWITVVQRSMTTSVTFRATWNSGFWSTGPDWQPIISCYESIYNFVVKKDTKEKDCLL